MARAGHVIFQYYNLQRETNFYLQKGLNAAILKKNFFPSERKMQEWFSEKLSQEEALSSFVINYDDISEKSSDKEISVVVQKITECFKYCLKSFNNNEIITENKNISINKKDILAPDLVVYAPETQSIVIIELKNIKEPTRQAGTELGAYAAEMKTFLPFLSEGEIINVIVSTEWPTLLRHYVFNEIVWQQKKMIGLEVVDTADGLMLAIVDPMIISEAELSLSLTSKQLGGYQLCLYDDQLYSGGEYFRMEAHENQMRTALHAMASKGNSMKSHGFAFLWRHCFERSLAPYNITVLNFAPFQSSDQVGIDSRFPNNEMARRLAEIVTDHDPEGHSYALDAITDYGCKFLNDICSPRPEGHQDWEYLKPLIFNETDALAFIGWGFFGELFFDFLAKRYADPEFDFDYDPMHPLLAIEMIDQIVYR